jgi:hypothetical protein
MAAGRKIEIFLSFEIARLGVILVRLPFGEANFPGFRPVYTLNPGVRCAPGAVCTALVAMKSGWNDE